MHDNAIDANRALAAGEMAERIARFEWAATPLGDRASWPASLRTAVDIMLEAAVPTGIYWGQELVLLYNDAWSTLIGEKHPNALGTPAREVFPEIWASIEPLFAGVRAGQGAAEAHDQLLPLNRGHGLKDAWFDYSFNPIALEDGTVGGILNIAVETTEKVRAEQARQASEVRYRELVEGANSAILRLAHDGTICFLNQYAQDLFGYSAAEAVGRPANLILPRRESTGRDLTGLFADVVAHAERHEESVNENLCSDGRRVWMLWKNRLVRDARGDVVEVLSIGSDITARKRAEAALQASEERYRHLFESMEQGVIYMDGEGRFTDANPAAERILGVPLEEMRSRTAFGTEWKVIREDGQDAPSETHPAAQALKTGTRCKAVMGVFNPRAESYRWLSVDAVPILEPEDSAVNRVYITFSDITEPRTLEGELRQADRRKDEFLATLAHELRNPLAPIQSGIGVLRLAGRDSAAGSRMLGVMERQVTHLVRLIDDLLDVSRITRGVLTLRKERVELGHAVREAIETCAPLLDAGERELSLDLPSDALWVHADRVRLTQVVTNLVSNAVRFTRVQGRIRVAVEERGARAAILVSDDGSGIDAELLGRVFDMFMQGDRMTQGLGVGLTLVRSLVELHGGTVEVESDGAGHGSTFLVTLPLGTDEQPELALQEGAAAPCFGARRVLVVDDNRDAAESLTSLLDALGAEVETVYDGPAALRATARMPEVIFLDIGMPGMDGYEVARRIRAAQDPSHHAFLVAVTGWGQDEDRRRSGEAGFDLHLVKPVSVEDIEGVARLLSARGAPQ